MGVGLFFLSGVSLVVTARQFRASVAVGNSWLWWGVPTSPGTQGSEQELKSEGRGRLRAGNSNALPSAPFFCPTVVSEHKRVVLHIWWVCRFLCDFYLKVRAVEIHQVGIWDVCHLPFSLASAYQIAGSTGLINQGAAPKRKNKYCSGFMESLYYYTAGDLNVFI